MKALSDFKEQETFLLLGEAIVCLLTLGSTNKLIPQPWHNKDGGGGGGLMEPPLGFRDVRIFRKVFTFSESLGYILNDEVYIMGCGTARGLLKKKKKKTRIFLQKWLHHLLLMTSYHANSH